MTLSGCANSGNISPGLRVYPAAPAFMSPVAIPDVNLSEDARILLAKHRAALIKANRNLVQSRAWYDDLSK